jgi:hypothetical protein
MASQRIKVSKLIRRDGPFCHYCNVYLTRTDGTCDHVVPKSMGGANSLWNFVLACGDCNNERGTDLHWCDCSFCGPLIEEFKSSPQYIERTFLAIMKYNRPVVRYRTKVWKVYVHHNEHRFKTWEDAMHFALTYGKEPRNGFRDTNR